MEHLDTFNARGKNEKVAVPSSHETLEGTLNELIQCQKEINALNKKLFALCKNDKEQDWLKSRGRLNFLTD